jgi:hypothetical protein
MVCFQFNSFCAHSQQEVFMLNLENDFARIRFRYHWYAMIGKCLREDTCYDVVSCDVLYLIVSKLRIMTLFL